MALARIEFSYGLELETCDVCLELNSGIFLKHQEVLKRLIQNLILEYPAYGEDNMAIRDIYSQTEHHMKRTGRAHTGLLEHITVPYYGTDTPINQVAQLGLADARTITVQPWDKKMVAVVEKAIRASDLGLNPATSGDIIRVPMPPLTEERRRELTKVARGEGEEAKVAVRNLRRDANNKIDQLIKDKEITEDEQHKAESDIQKLTDKYVAEIDKLVEEKEKEIMTV